MTRRAGGGIQHRKQDFVRGEIFGAAIGLFSTHGYEATTVEQIATAAGVSRRTFFRYFASKDDLMVTAIDSYGDLLTTAIRGAGTNAAPLQIVRHAVTHVAETVVTQPRVRETMTISKKSMAARRAQLAELEVVTDRITREFARVLGRRARSPHTARLMASLTIAALSQTFRTWYDQQPRRVGDIVDDILDSITELAAGGPAGKRRGVTS
jgi:AcrR family transcriptional regulator